ncbi:helix-turn-helix domain-containing protein [Roseateles sp. DC23W]|uniref:Helix-turn-helix domain-containing protein n=1 Tax=Pelomonas dachongensis TaxID=3299029 RepID=A0ABW7EU02_9BURK
MTELGARIRAQRQRQRVSATHAAEAAGLSRVTLHRIERGEPSVTMGNGVVLLGPFPPMERLEVAAEGSWAARRDWRPSLGPAPR